MFEIVEFPGERAMLRGRFYAPPLGGRAPIVVMSHGTSGTLTMVADRYSEVFQSAGLGALLYDHRGYGISGGEPRQELNGWVDARGIRHAMTFAATLPGIDADKIALWGASYSANLALIVAAVDERPAAVIAAVPAAGADLPDGSRFEALRDRLLDGDIETGERVGPMPIVSSDQINAPSLLPEIQAYRWFIENGGRHGSGWVNEITVIEDVSAPPLWAGVATPFIKAAVFATIAIDDEMGNAVPAVSRAAFDAIPGEKELLETEGGHFAAFWYPSNTFDQVSAAQRDFLLKTFGGA